MVRSPRYGLRLGKGSSQQTVQAGQLARRTTRLLSQRVRSILARMVILKATIRQNRPRHLVERAGRNNQRIRLHHQGSRFHHLEVSLHHLERTPPHQRSIHA